MTKKDNAKIDHRNHDDHLATLDMLKVFYNRPAQLSDENGNPTDAPHDGSMALLALGHIGLIEWRKSRDKFLKEKTSKASQIENDTTGLPNNNL
ncbi:MAG TPA: hypothetical protein VJY41_03415 [Prolixibacteraceae bacterium]|nr:hypothetical protein [Prolixibacteraceae bacterium]